METNYRAICQLYNVNTRTIITRPAISSYEYMLNPFEFTAAVFERVRLIR
jgi:hypothetical protein